MVYDCIIIGAGPAGLMAAAHLPGRKGKILLLEGERKFAQKLLLSGSGQCNLTHSGDVKSFFGRYGGKDRFVRKALSRFSNKDVQAFFENENVPLVTRSDGKVFPESMDARDIFSCLRNRAVESGVDLRAGMKVESVTYAGSVYTLRGAFGDLRAKTLLLAAGGASYPMTGSDGSGFDLARQLGHAVVDPRPALSPVYIENFPLRRLAGLTFSGGQLSHWRDGRKIGGFQGDILVTHTGLSGPCILDNARYISPSDVLMLRLMDRNASEAEVESALLSGNKKQVKTILSEYTFKKTADLIADLYLAQPDIPCAELGKGDRKAIVRAMGGLTLKVKSLGSLKSAMATAGGVSLGDVKAGSMASKIVAGLYFAGEILDVDGDTGGYNIQWAFSSGRLAAESIESFLKEA